MNTKQKLFAWRVYKALHPLLRFRKISADMLNFIQHNVTNGTTVSIDSFPYLLSKKIQIDKIIELNGSQVIWNKLKVPGVAFVDSCHDVTGQYNNIILAGLTAFRYQTVAECSAVIGKLVPALKENGTIIVALPITTLLFHRLKFSYNQIIDELGLLLASSGLTISNRLLDIDVFYIKLTKS
jgi:hypothetical protein